MYVIKEKVLKVLKAIGVFVILFTVSAVITISQRNIINPDEMSIQQSILIEKTNEANEAETKVNTKKSIVEELQKFVEEKNKELENRAKNTKIIP